VHHRGRRVVAASAARRVVRAARRPVFRRRCDAADLRGPEGSTVPVVFRRNTDPATARTAHAARQTPGRQQDEPRSALGLPVGWIAVVRRPARAAVLRLPARRGGERCGRIRAAVPQADRLPARRHPGAGRAGPDPSCRALASRYGRVVAGCVRCVHDLAVHRAGRRPRVSAGAVRARGGVPAHPEDGGAGPVVARDQGKPG
jgi:hypothetical protein